MNERRESIPGSGLSIAAISALLGVSVGLFLVYDGLLWRAPREASHVSRFAVSYLAVIPLAAILLLLQRRFDWSRLITSTGVVWAAKLLVTAVLYQAFARGTATHLVSQAPSIAPTPHIAKSSEYQAATTFDAGAIRGRATIGGKPVAGAVLFLDAPSAGRAMGAPARVDLVISDARYEQPVYVVRDGDDVRLVNRDGALHTVHFHGAGLAPANRPTSRSAEPQPFALPEPGVYQIRCDTHPDESTRLVVVDHPYVTRSDAQGSFSLDRVPAGEARLVALLVDERGAHRLEQKVSLAPGATRDVNLDFASAPAF